MKIAIPEEEYMLKGNSACAGCTAMIALRFALKAAGPKTVLLVSACCMVVCEGTYPNTCTAVPTLDTAFACSASMASGVAAALRKEDANVIVFAGDGGTADIGIQSLSGAIERGTNFLYVCYDNEAYANTGMQRSGSTPYRAVTTTTPFGKKEDGKDVPSIIAAHRIPYLATASPSYPLDLYEKVKKALSIKGPKYIHVVTPCPPGWRFPLNKGIEIGRLGVKSGIWVLYEIENGNFRLSSPSKRVLEGDKIPVREYLRAQGRFDLMSEKDIERVQRKVDYRLDEFRRLMDGGICIWK
ncbi:MAG: thiamine pyrophosphate-dependent enzyme [Candidatus Syntropharchaeia archaeon]